MRGHVGFALLLLLALVAVACGGGGAQPTNTPGPPTPTPFATSFDPSTPRPTAEPDPTDRPDPTSTADGTAPEGEVVRARVVEVIDGDTIRVRLEGAVVPVRYIGIDAPERGTGQTAKQATRANERFVGGGRVWLELDESETDQFSRLLRHAWIRDRDGEWLLVNAELVRLGFAEAKSYPPDTLYDSVYAAAQGEAQEAGVGMWGE